MYSSLPTHSSYALIKPNREKKKKDQNGQFYTILLLLSLVGHDQKLLKLTFSASPFTIKTHFRRFSFLVIVQNSLPHLSNWSSYMVSMYYKLHIVSLKTHQQSLAENSTNLSELAKSLRPWGFLDGVVREGFNGTSVSMPKHLKRDWDRNVTNFT